METVYVVILPVSLFSIFSNFFFFFNLADVAKLLKFAFLDYKLAGTFSQTFVFYLYFLLCKFCLRFDHLAIEVLWAVSKNI